MVVDQCPSKEMLGRFLNGKLSEDESEQLGQHLVECPECDAAAALLEAEQSESEPDSLAAILKARGALPALSSQGQRGSIGASENSPADSAVGGRSAASSCEANAFSAAHALWDRLDEVVARSGVSSAAITGSVGSYDLLETLGRGGMGTVYLARHRELDKHVAIKLLPSLSAKNEEFVARFRREMRAAGKLNHPAIVKATDAGELDGVHFLVMEVVDGADLSRISRAIEVITVADACEVVRQAALGIAHAHEQGIVHRDIKPSNLMLEQAGEVKILDFGLAHLFQADGATTGLTTVGQLMGTLDYMAPEQATPGSIIDVCADVYSLAATLFTLLANVPPLACRSRMSPIEKLQVLARHELRVLDELRPGLPAKLVKLIESGLATDPAQRPPSAIKFAEELQEFATGADLPKLSSDAAQRIASGQEKVDVTNKLTQTVTASGGDQSPGRIGKWLAGGLVSLLFIVGAIITLELTKGKLVIDSEAPVTIRLVDDADRATELNIQPGVTTTRLRDGKYEISLATESDRVILSESVFSIRRGETEVARVEKVVDGSTDSSATIGSITTQSPVATQPKPMSKGPIQPGDVLAISVRGIIPHDLPTTLSVIPTYQAGTRPPVRGEIFQIDESGNLTVPLMKELNVSGLTPSQLRKLLTKTYKDNNILRQDAQGTTSVQFLMRAGESLPVKNLTPANSGVSE